MADVVYLHIGAPKTGTTYVQDRLFASRKALAEHGIHYPVSMTDSDQFRPALDLAEVSWGGRLESARGEWDKLARRVRRSEGTAIVSHEILSGVTPEKARRALTSFGDAEVHLVYSARDLARQIPAEWQESLKNRRQKTFRRQLKLLRNQDRNDSTLWFWRSQHLPDVMARWAPDLPPERVHVVVAPPAGAPRGELWERYCRAFAIDPALAPETEGRANASIGLDEAAVLRRLNRRLKNTGIGQADYGRLVRQVVVQQGLAPRTSRRITVPPKLWPWVEEVTEEWLEHLHTSGVNVVGDPEELRPVFPDADSLPQRPLRSKARREREAAIDALVAVILEAASRPDPHDSPRARVSRAAQRLRAE